MFTLTPAFARAARKLGFSRSLRDIAARSWVVAPETTTTVPPAIHDPGDWDRVTGVQPDSSFALERRRVAGGCVTHAPTTAFLLRGAVLSGGHLMVRGAVHLVGKGRPRAFGAYFHTEPVTSALVASRYGSTYFGHWITDDLPLMLAGAALAQPVAPTLPLSPHQRDYMRLCRLDRAVRDDVRFREIIVLEDFAQNDYKRERYLTLRERLRDGRKVVAHPGVFLLRKGTGARRSLVNEEALAELFVRRGGRALCPEEHSTEEVLDACLGARVVMGVEGSHLAHAFLGVELGGAMLVLQPPHLFNAVMKGYCDALGMRFAFVVGHPAEGGFRIDPDAMLRMLDKLELRSS